jgi:dephospho-CoA kinase
VLGAKVFGNAERMQALRDAMGDIPGHFMGILESWRTTLPANGMALLESVNLLENGYMSKCDAGWLVVCERETAIARLTGDRGLTEAEAEQRLASARDWRERTHLADQVIHNEGTVDELLATTRIIVDETIALYRAGKLPRPRWYESQDAASRA